jgi:hypothetical protein
VSTGIGTGIGTGTGPGIGTVVGRAASTAAGAGLGLVFGTVARVRPADKPLHPRGTQFSGVLERWGTRRPRGVDWLDGTGTEKVLIRFSRAMGLPGPLPDILGLTLRVQASTWSADVLLATTGTGTPGRFALLPRRSPATEYGSLLPYRAPSGPVLFLARCGDGDPYPSAITLCVGGPRDQWDAFGQIALGGECTPSDPTLSFDPLLNVVPGLEIYPWVFELRERAYAAARRSRT